MRVIRFCPSGLMVETLQVLSGLEIPPKYKRDHEEILANITAKLEERRHEIRVDELIKFFNEADFTEPYWEKIVEAYLLLHYSASPQIIELFRLKLWELRNTSAVAMYPMVITGIMRATNRLTHTARATLPGYPGDLEKVCTKAIARLFRYYAEGAAAVETSCSEQTLKSLSAALMNYLNWRTGCEIVQECFSDMGPGEDGNLFLEPKGGAHKVFLELHHRLFGAICVTAQNQALRAVYKKEPEEESA